MNNKVWPFFDESDGDYAAFLTGREEGETFIHSARSLLIDGWKVAFDCPFPFFHQERFCFFERSESIHAVYQQRNIASISSLDDCS